MKTIRALVVHICVSLFIFSCQEEEVTSRDYPRLNTLPVSNISPLGALFNAEVTYRGDFEIISYGFVCGGSKYLNLDYSDKVYIQKPLTGSKFSAEMRTGLIDKSKYYVRSFITTKDFTVYGKVVEFVSQGSGAPEIISFSPEVGSWGDTLSIKGKYFSNVIYKNNVKLGDVQLGTFYSTDTLIKAVIEKGNYPQFVDVSVSISGKTAVAQKKFEYRQ